MGAVWSDSKNNYNDKIYDMSEFDRGNGTDNATIRGYFDQNVYYFKGFDFENYKSTDPSLQEMTNAEVSAVRNGVSGYVTKPNGPYSLIGHSQGGLRALGFITQTKKSNPGSENNINAVITISGLNRGLKMLDGGLGEFKSRASEKINTLGNGMRAAIGIFPIIDIYAQAIPRNSLANAFDIFVALIPSNWRPYYLEAWKSTDASKCPQLGGMIPNSQYIKDNVIATESTTYKEKIGERTIVTTVKDRTTDGTWVEMPTTYIVDEYRYYTITEIVTRFDANVPLGFIVGENNNTLGMHDNWVTEPLIRLTLIDAAIKYGVVQGVHIAKCVGIFGLFNGSITMAQDAGKAAQLMINFDSELNNIKGSSDNDGLVAVESQYIPKANMKNRVLGSEAEGFSRVGLDHIKIERLPRAYEIAKIMVAEGKTIRENK